MTAKEIRVAGYEVERSEEVLTADALAFVGDLHRRFSSKRDELLENRRSRRAEVSLTGKLDFLPQTSDIRGASWTVPTAPADLSDRRVEITGPTDRRMAIHALNCGARVWLADFEDANAPTWSNLVSGQVNLVDAIDQTIEAVSQSGDRLAINTDRPSTIVVRPRGWHLDERHVLVDERPVVAAFFDFGLFFFHNARRQIERHSGPYFYLPKMESHLEARLWNEVFVHAQEALDMPVGTIRATALIETVPAAFEMDEILFELRQHASGLNAGRWDYLFSMIKNFRDQGAEFVLPDRNEIRMTTPMMRSYTELLVHTCHRRGAFAIGGMAAFIPNRRVPEINEQALARVREDKDREAADGFDGSWVAHPDLVPICRQAFDDVLGGSPNQVDRLRDDVQVSAGDLLSVAKTPGQVTEAGLTNDITVCLQYVEAWLRGHGAVALFNLMEDVATAEIARSQVWQWVHNRTRLSDGRIVTPDLVRLIADNEIRALHDSPEANVTAAARRWDDARQVFERVALDDDYAEFLTYETYPLID
jgi:malate synthase